MPVLQFKITDSTGTTHYVDFTSDTTRIDTALRREHIRPIIATETGADGSKNVIVSGVYYDATDDEGTHDPINYGPSRIAYSK